MTAMTANAAPADVTAGQAARERAAAAPAPLSGGQKWAVGIALPISLALMVMSFTEMFTAVRDAMKPVAHNLAWTIPVGTDAGMVVLSLLDMLFESMGMRARWMPWATRMLIGLQLGLNVNTAHTANGRLGRAVLPVLFVAVIEAWRFFWRKRKNLAVKTDRDKIPLTRWLADFSGTRELRRLMILWDILELTDALEMLQQIQLAEATLRKVHGWKWRRRVAADLLLKLHTKRYMDEAFAAIKRIGAEFDKVDADAGKASAPKTGKPPAAGSPPDNKDTETVTDCCAAHRKAVEIRDSDGAVAKLEYNEFQARKFAAEYAAAHGKTIGAETIRGVFRIGIEGAREARTRLAAVPAAAPAGSGQPGRVGSAGSGRVGSGSRVESGPAVGSGTGPGGGA